MEGETYMLSGTRIEKNTYHNPKVHNGTVSSNYQLCPGNIRPTDILFALILRSKIKINQSIIWSIIM